MLDMHRQAVLVNVVGVSLAELRIHVRWLLCFPAGIHVFFPEEPKCNAMTHQFLVHLLIIRWNKDRFGGFFRKKRLKKRLLIKAQQLRIALLRSLCRRKDRSDRVPRNTEGTGDLPSGVAV